MPDHSSYLRLRLAGQELDLPPVEDVPLSITLEMEDEEDFEQKKGSVALDVTVPATLENSRILAGFCNPASEDTSPNGMVRGPQTAVLSAGGTELLIGKGFISEATHTDQPEGIKIDLYGDNADWVIDNEGLSLSDVVTSETHVFDGKTIKTSWGPFLKEYVYAPVRYRQPFSEGDTVVLAEQMRPALFLHPLILRGFEAAGYRLQSTFFKSRYFRQMVLPWVWGNFLYMDSKELDVLKFKAICRSGGQKVSDVAPLGTWDSVYTAEGYGTMYDHLMMDQDYAPGGFDNGGSYTWSGIENMIWTYLPAYSYFGMLHVGFELQVNYLVQASFGSSVAIYVDWRVVRAGTPDPWTAELVAEVSAGSTQSNVVDKGIRLLYFQAQNVQPDDTVEVRFRAHGYKSGFGDYMANIDQGGHPDKSDATYLALRYFKKPLGGIVDFKKYPRLKEYKWLDLLRGVTDLFDLRFHTDVAQKVVYIEPAHPYSLSNDLEDVVPGFYTGNSQNWEPKQDLSRPSTIENFRDYSRDFSIKMKDDAQDGILKLIQDRHGINVSEARYQFPERFNKGKKEMANRFFSQVMHYQVQQWSGITGITPQLICIVPENISNTSQTESDKTFEPKLAWYSGNIAEVGGWKYDLQDGSGVMESSRLPFMFAVNYHPGGEDSPILTYGDQGFPSASSSSTVIGAGLFRRFFLPRFAIMRHGKRYTTHINLNTTDVLAWPYHEYIRLGQHLYELIKISGYKPLTNETTEVMLWQCRPVTKGDSRATFPSAVSILGYEPVPNTPDFKYHNLLALPSDIKS